MAHQTVLRPPSPCRKANKNGQIYRSAGQAPGFSTAFSTVVEILGEKPKACDAMRAPDRQSELATVAHASNPGICVLGFCTSSVALKFRPGSEAGTGAGPFRGPDGEIEEGQAYLPAKHAPPREDPRLPRANVDQERPDRPQAAPRQGAQAPHGCRRRLGKRCRVRSASSAGRISSVLMRPARGSTAVS